MLVNLSPPIRFIIIGLLAALTHYCIAIFLINRNYLDLKYANFIAFLTAFWVSYFGHHYFTFHSQQKVFQTLPKYLIVATSGFIFNETILLVLNYYLPNLLPILVILVIILTAIFTFFLNRTFAFRY